MILKNYEHCLFPVPATVKILSLLHNIPDDKHIILSDIAKVLNITYSTIIKIRTELINERLITTEKVGRVVYVSLTPEGHELAKICNRLMECISR